LRALPARAPRRGDRLAAPCRRGRTLPLRRARPRDRPEARRGAQAHPAGDRRPARARRGRAARRRGARASRGRPPGTLDHGGSAMLIDHGVLRIRAGLCPVLVTVPLGASSRRGVFAREGELPRFALYARTFPTDAAVGEWVRADVDEMQWLAATEIAHAVGVT